MTDTKKLIEELDSADLFLRNRAHAKPDPLTDYDIMLMEDAAKACDEAARVLEKAIILPYTIGSTLYYIDRKTNEIQTTTVEWITITKSGPKPLLKSFKTSFWKKYKIGVNAFWSEEEAITARKELEEWLHES